MSTATESTFKIYHIYTNSHSHAALLQPAMTRDAIAMCIASYACPYAL